MREFIQNRRWELGLASIGLLVIAFLIPIPGCDEKKQTGNQQSGSKQSDSRSPEHDDHLQRLRDVNRDNRESLSK